MFIFLIVKEKNLFNFKIDTNELKNMMGFVWPLVLGAMLHFFTKGFDIVYLERLNDSNELGYYVVAFQIVGYIGLFQSSVGNTFQPDIYKAMIDRNYVTAAKYMVLTFSLLAIIVSIFYVLSPFIINILTAGKYNESVVYARILSISQLMMSIYYITTELFIISGQTRSALISKCIGVVFTIFMYSYVIANWQYIGAAWGVSISFLMLTLINVMFLFYKRSILFRRA
jgi:O-antigen/teichoic acid export membrane protein